jgi:beta-lactamase class A
LKLALPISLAVLAAAAPEFAPDPANAAIVRAAQEAEKGAGAIVGVSVLHIESGRHAAFRGGERFQMASVFKVPVAIAVLGAVETGTLRLEQEVEIRKSDRQKVGPLYDGWKPGMRVTVERMATSCSSTATTPLPTSSSSFWAGRPPSRRLLPRVV